MDGGLRSSRALGNCRKGCAQPKSLAAIPAGLLLSPFQQEDVIACAMYDNDS